ncbi:hypothetical protein Micbo1qcDRAFT_223663 [Microdochium bolleyi]|uniref:Zn(2)-C6 fungal-type domain-containing protein n=1 Tax=Microdochium bolleyi TaxID=196109 RepID=A0A136IJR7_9PEZI|nr:hypothetical protein Micbo1qcDRAFT_223663 [Microdochium bolleyi]
MIHVQPARQYQLRRACDRCHKSKLRCLRENDDDDACQRCLQAAVPCSSSPASRPQRHKSNSTNSIPRHRPQSSQGQGQHGMELVTASSSSSSATLANSRAYTAAALTNTLHQHRAGADSINTAGGPGLIWHATTANITTTTRPDVPSISSATRFDVLPDFHDQAAFDQLFLLHDTDMDITLDDAPGDSSGPSPPSSSSCNSRAAGAGRHNRFPPTAANTILSSSSSAMSSVPSLTPMSHSGLDVTAAPNQLAPLEPSLSPPPRQRHHQQDHGAASLPALDYYMRKVSDVGLTLLTHLQVMPIVTPDTEDDDHDDDGAEQLISNTSRDEQTQFSCPIDQVFHLSEVFVETLAELLPRLPPPFTSTPISPLSPDHLSLDAASELLIFSTYLRLLETYDRILQHIQLHCRQTSRPAAAIQAGAAASASSTSSSSSATGGRTQLSSSGMGSGSSNSSNAMMNAFNLPGWSIGTFSLSAQSKTQQLFMIHLIETMLTRARDLVSDVVAKKATLGYRGNWECFGGLSLSIVPDLAVQAIRTREKAAIRRVVGIKAALRG